MDTDQIATTKAALVAIDKAIAQAEAALRTADADRTASLNAMLVELRAERTRLQFELINEESAAVVVAPVGAMAMPAGMRGMRGVVGVAPRAAKAAPMSAASKAKVKAVHKQFKAAVTDQTMVDATLKFAKDVRDLARTLRSIGDNPTVPKRPKKASR